MAARGVEIEVKIAVADARALRRALRRQGFALSERALERDTVLDTATQGLRHSLQLLRLRRHGKRWKLTYKGPPAADAQYKERPEIETAVDDGERFLQICNKLGYRPVFVYEKKRATYRRGKRGPVATLDVTPIGTFLELEGPRRWIDRTAKALGFSPSDYITASYGQLYLDHCRRSGRKPANMVFGA